MTVTPLMPEWPDVRCARCGHIYTVNLTGGDGVQLVTGNCPACRHQKFNTQLAGNVEAVDVELDTGNDAA